MYICILLTPDLVCFFVSLFCFFRRLFYFSYNFTTKLYKVFEANNSFNHKFILKFTFKHTNTLHFNIQTIFLTEFVSVYIVCIEPTKSTDTKITWHGPISDTLQTFTHFTAWQVLLFESSFLFSVSLLFFFFVFFSCLPFRFLQNCIRHQHNSQTNLPTYRLK